MQKITRLVYLLNVLFFLLSKQLFPQTTDMKFQHLNTEHGLSFNAVTDIIQDSLGFMWFGTWRGFNKYDGYTFTVYKHDPDDPYSLSHNWIFDLCLDDSGYFWLATNGGGLEKFDPQTERFYHFKHDPANHNSLSHNMVTVLCKDSDGIIWLGTALSGIDQFDPQTKRFVHYSFNP